MLTLYGMYRSRASRNIWLLEELGAKYVLKPIIQAYRLPDPKAPETRMLAALNGFSPASSTTRPETRKATVRLISGMRP